MQTDAFAAQMVREMLSEIEKQGTILVNYATILEPIARRYIEKAQEDEAERALTAQVEEIERLRTAGNALVEAIERAAPRLMDMEVQMQNRGYLPPRPEHRFADQFEAFRAALKAAQEVKA